MGRGDLLTDARFGARTIQSVAGRGESQYSVSSESSLFYFGFRLGGKPSSKKAGREAWEVSPKFASRFS